MATDQMLDVAVEILPFQSGAAKACLMPSAMDPVEAQLYEKVRTFHCDRKAESHACRGRVTLDRNGMTLSCPLCGDHRTVYRKVEANDQAD